MGHGKKLGFAEGGQSLGFSEEVKKTFKKTQYIPYRFGLSMGKVYNKKKPSGFAFYAGELQSRASKYGQIIPGLFTGLVCWRKFTGNPWVFTIKLIGLSCKFSHHQIL